MRFSCLTAFHGRAPEIADLERFVVGGRFRNPAVASASGNGGSLSHIFTTATISIHLFYVVIAGIQTSIDSIYD